MSVSHFDAFLWDAISVFYRLGFSVIPLLGGSDPQAGKRPAGRWLAYRFRRPAPHELYEWFVRQGHRAYGVVCGQVSGVVVLDVDDPQQAAAFIEAFPHLADTLIIESGVRGTPHFYWRVDFPVNSRAFPGGDLKGEGGYVVGPGVTMGAASWSVAQDRPLRAISRAELERVLRFFGIADKAAPAQTEAAERTPADFAGLYRYYVDRYRSRNQALFQTACHIRDQGFPVDWASAALTPLHVAEPPCGPHSRESPRQREREAAATIHSVYSRPARHQVEQTTGPVSRLPNSIREALLTRPDGAAILRVLEGAHLAGLLPGAAFTEAALCRLLAGHISRSTIRKALAAYLTLQTPIFPPCTPPTGVDAAATASGQKNAFLSGGQKQTRFFTLPEPRILLDLLNVPPTPGDPIGWDDIASVRLYRQALHREFIRRRPGCYSQSLLGARVNVCRRTIRRYNRELPLSITPMYDETPLHWSNVHLLPREADQIPLYGVYLLDQTGKRWPAKREIAERLLKRRVAVSQMRQQANHYRCADAPDVPTTPAALIPRVMQQPVPQAVTPPRQCPANAQEGASKPFLPPDTAKEPQKREKPAKPRRKRFFRQPLPDAGLEALAREMRESVAGLSLCNARRLIDTYGAAVIAPVLRRCVWLDQRGKVAHPAAFLLTAIRVSWRAAHDWQPAPVLKLEPRGRSRRRPAQGEL